MQKICLDTGVISIYLSKDRTKKVEQLINGVIDKKIKCFILKPVLCEVFYHICKLYGKEIANSKIISFIHQIQPELIDLDESLILGTGLLKCQHRPKLSYIDCMSIAFCLKENIEFHTTEKLVKNIPQNTLDKLNLKKYEF